MSTSNMSPRLPSDAHAKPRWACLGKPPGLGAVSGNILTWQPARWPVAHVLAPACRPPSSRRCARARPSAAWSGRTSSAGRPASSPRLRARHVVSVNINDRYLRGRHCRRPPRTTPKVELRRSSRKAWPPRSRHLGVHVLLQAWSVVGGMVHLKIIRPGPTSAMVRERT